MQTTYRIVSRQARPLSQIPRGAYGLWTATVRTSSGEEFTGSGLSEHQALYRAELRARVSGGVA